MSEALNSVYNSHLEGEERKLAVAEAVAENNYNKIAMAYEMCLMQEKQMLADAELKVFSESGTYDDLAYLIEGGEEETGEKKKNILQKMVDAIINLCNSIMNTIKSAFGKGSPDDEVEVSQDAIEKHGKIASVKAKITKAASLLKSGNFLEALKEVGPILSAIAAVAAAGAATAVMVKKKRSEVEAMANEENESIKTVRDAVNAVKSKLGSFKDLEPVNKALSKFKEIIDSIKENAKNLSAKLGAGINKAKEKVKGAAKDAADAAGEAAANVADAAGSNAGSATEIKVKNTTFKVDTNGNVRAFNKDGGEVKVTNEFLPAKVKEVIEQIKNGTKESITTDEIQSILGDAYTVEFVDDNMIEIKASDLFIESEELDTENSIFGSEIEASADNYEESAEDAMDKELESLAELFANI